MLILSQQEVKATVTALIRKPKWKLNVTVKPLLLRYKDRNLLSPRHCAPLLMLGSVTLLSVLLAPHKEGMQYPADNSITHQVFFANQENCQFRTEKNTK